MEHTSFGAGGKSYGDIPSALLPWHDVPAGDLPALRMASLPAFGFRLAEDGAYHSAEPLLDGTFCLYLRVTEEGAVSTLLLDAETREPYVLHIVEGTQGAFVGQVRAAYDAVLARLGEMCGVHGSFQGAYVDRILRYVWEIYADRIEYPWEKVDGAVIRSHITRKWYAVFLSVAPQKIGLGGTSPIHILDLHGTEEAVARLLKEPNYFPGYHMNRKYWYTVCLDGSIPFAELRERIDASFALSQKKCAKKSSRQNDRT